MKSAVYGIALSLALALVATSAGTVRAEENEEEDFDHDRALRALSEGRARPFVEILDRVRTQLGGEVIGVGFERENNRWIYKLKVITPAGSLRELHVDALTAELVEDEED